MGVFTSVGDDRLTCVGVSVSPVVENGVRWGMADSPRGPATGGCGVLASNDQCMGFVDRAAQLGGPSPTATHVTG